MASHVLHPDITTVVHEALAQADVVRLLCEGCDERTLASLARTTRTFQEPALSLLWSEIPNLAPLIRCMPSDLCMAQRIRVTPAGKSGHVRRSISFQRAILPGDWIRFEIHAAHVRKLGFHKNDSLTPPAPRYELHPSVYPTLSCAALGKHLLPNLREIRWATDDEVIFPYVSLFTSEPIRRVELALTDATSRFGFSLLPSLAKVCPHITRLTLELQLKDRPNEILVKNTLSTITAWGSLSHFGLIGFPDNTILSISRLPALRTLSVTRAIAYDKPWTPYEKGFSMLETLHLDRCYIELCIELVALMSGTNLHELKLYCFEEPSRHDWFRLFDSMRTSISRHSLHTIDVSTSEDGSIEPADSFPITLDHISPLLVFTSLTKVCITSCHGFDLDNSEIQIVASTWTQLQTLKLGTTRPSTEEPRITLDGLISIAKWCPSLVHLTILFNASGTHDYTEKPGKGISNANLKTLKVLDSPIDHPPSVAAFLSDIFPNLSSIDATVEYTDATAGDQATTYAKIKRKWKEVEELTAIFGTVRRQEIHFKAGKA